MQRWEYKTILRKRDVGIFRIGPWNVEPKELLAGLGDEGWELVGITSQSSALGAQAAGVTSEELWLFKRPAG